MMLNQTTWADMLFYLRIILFPLCAMGFVISSVFEYQMGKSKLRLAVMLITAASLLIWMTLTIAAEFYPAIMGNIRTWAVTPIITLLTILIWYYAIARTRKR